MVVPDAFLSTFDVCVQRVCVQPITTPEILSPRRQGRRARQTRLLCQSSQPGCRNRQTKLSCTWEEFFGDNPSVISCCMLIPLPQFVKGDIQSADLVTHILKSEDIDTIMHFAAQVGIDVLMGELTCMSYGHCNTSCTHTDTCGQLIWQLAGIYHEQHLWDPRAPGGRPHQWQRQALYQRLH